MRVDKLLRNAAGEIIGAARERRRTTSAAAASSWPPATTPPPPSSKAQYVGEDAAKVPPVNPNNTGDGFRLGSDGRRRHAADGPPVRGAALRAVDACPTRSRCCRRIPGCPRLMRFVVERLPKNLLAVRHPRRADQLGRPEQHHVRAPARSSWTARAACGERGLRQADRPRRGRQASNTGIHGVRRRGSRRSSPRGRTRSRRSPVSPTRTCRTTSGTARTCSTRPTPSRSSRRRCGHRPGGAARHGDAMEPRVRRGRQGPGVRPPALRRTGSARARTTRSAR